MKQWKEKETNPMPEITRFYGIIIKMFFKPKEHAPSHIHALYGEYVGEFNIRTLGRFAEKGPRTCTWAADGLPDWIARDVGQPEY